MGFGQYRNVHFATLKLFLERAGSYKVYLLGSLWEKAPGILLWSSVAVRIGLPTRVDESWGPGKLLGPQDRGPRVSWGFVAGILAHENPQLVPAVPRRGTSRAIACSATFTAPGPLEAQAAWRFGRAKSRLIKAIAVNRGGPGRGL
jgi:hypothetical protein